MRLTQTRTRANLPVLLSGDVLALLAFVLVGLSSHQMTSNVAANLMRIAAPLLIGWFAVAPLIGAYRLPGPGTRGAFLLRSVLAWPLGIGVGLLLRNTVFGSPFSPVFAIITLGFTGLFLLGWRALFVWLFAR